MDRYSSPAFHKVTSGQFRVLKFIGLLVVLFLFSFFVTVPSTYSETPRPDVSQLKIQDFTDPSTLLDTQILEEYENNEINSTTVASIKKKELENQEEQELEGMENSTFVDTIRLKERDDPIFENLTTCQPEEWNNVTLDVMLLENTHRQWIEQGVFETPTNSSFPIELIASFAHREHISITLASPTALNTSVFCRYYDCKKNEMVRQSPSLVFPESTVYCPRRAGAKFISLTESLEDRAQYPVPIVPHLKPSHFLTVCVSIDLNATNYFQVVEFIEYYKLQGASFFHVYIKNSREFNRVILDDYVRTGEVQVIVLSDNIGEQEQINDCHHRNKFFSKWSTFSRIEDKIQMVRSQLKISEYLDSIKDPNTNVLQWTLNSNSQILIRPERVVSMLREPIIVYTGVPPVEVHGSVGFLRRPTNNTSPLTFDNFADNVPSDLAFRKELIHNTLGRVKWVYKPEDVDCRKRKEASLKFGRNVTCVDDK